MTQPKPVADVNKPWCNICGNIIEPHQLNVLIDQNSHKWRVCPICVSELWGLRQPIHQERMKEETAVDIVLDMLRNQLLGVDDE